MTEKRLLKGSALCLISNAIVMFMDLLCPTVLCVNRNEVEHAVDD